MKIKATTRINAMLRMYPQLEDVFELNDVDVDRVSDRSVKAVCFEYELDLDEVLGDLRSALRDSAGEGWLVADEELEDAYDEDDEDDEDEDEDEFEEIGSGDGYSIKGEDVDEDDDWD